MEPKEIIKKAREDQGLTQEAFAASIGLSSRTYQRYEEGSFPKYKNDTIRLIDEKLGTNVYAILYDKGSRPATDVTGQNGSPPAFIPVSWQDYVKLIHFSLEALKAGQNEILLQQAKTRAEVRGYGKYHLVKDAKGKRERFDKLLAEVDKLVNDELSEDDTEGNPSGS